MHIGRIISTSLIGLLFLLFVSVDLVLFGVVPLNSAVVTILLIVGLVGGGLLGWFVGRRAEHRSMASSGSST